MQNVEGERAMQLVLTVDDNGKQASTMRDILDLLRQRSVLWDDNQICD